MYIDFTSALKIAAVCKSSSYADNSCDVGASCYPNVKSLEVIHPLRSSFLASHAPSLLYARSPMLVSTHTHPFNGPLSGTTQVSRYQKGKTNLDFTEARDSGWQWHQLGYMQVCTSLQTDNHASIPPLGFLQARCPSCRPANSVKALKAKYTNIH